MTYSGFYGALAVPKADIEFSDVVVQTDEKNKLVCSASVRLKRLPPDLEKLIGKAPKSGLAALRQELASLVSRTVYMVQPTADGNFYVTL
jgi:hypothetical protein